MNINTRNLGFVNFNNEEMQWVKFNGVTVYEAWKNLIASGVPPLTLTKCKGVDLVDYKIFGNSEQKILPNEYQQIEYIESTGTQYIDTGIIPNQDTGFDIEFLTKNILTATDGKFGSIMGARQGSADRELQLSTYSTNSKGIFRYGNNTYDAGLTVNTKIHISLKNRVYTNNDDLKYAVAGTFECPSTLTVFALNHHGTKTQHGSLQLFSLKLYDGDILIRDYVPCYRKSDNVIGLYDLVEDKFYINKGTGTFVKGNDTPTPETPIEIESVGDKTSNLINEDTVYAGDIWKIENKTYTSTNNSYSNLEFRDITIEKGKTYILSCEVLVPNKNYYYRLRSGTTNITTPVDVTETGKRSLTFTATETYTDVKLQCFGLSNSSGEFSFTKPQLIEGDMDKEYEPYGKYKIPVKVSGKNLFNIDKYSGYIDISKYKVGDNLVLSLKDSYVLKIATSAGASSVLQVNSNKIAFTMTQVIKDVGRLYIVSTKTYTYETKENLLDQNVQLEYGTEPTKYESYHEPITTNIYLDEPLRKVDSYADYIDFKNGKVVRKIYNEFLTTVSAMSSDSTTYKKFLTDISQKPLIFLEPGEHIVQTRGYVMSNKFKTIEDAYNVLGNRVNCILPYITTQGINRVAYTFDDSAITTVEQAQEKIGNGFDVYYVLGTPTEETIEPPNIPTIKGTTILEVDTTIQPSNMEVVYKGKE